MMDSLLADVRYSIRNLLKRPAFTAVAVVTLALGIGANTAIFTLLNAVTFKQLPVTRPDELVLCQDSADEGTSNGDPYEGEWRRFSYASYQYFLAHDQSYQGLSAFRSGESRVSVTDVANKTAESQRASTHLVSGNYFNVLGVNAFLGRALTPEDDKPGAPPAAVMSYGYWKKEWNSDSRIINKEVLINGQPFTVVGVMPPEFFGVRVRRSPDLWVPLVFQPQIELRESYFQNPRVFWLNFVGRLKPGVQFEQAQASANVSLHQFLMEEAGSQPTADYQQSMASSYIKLAPGARGISGLRVAYSKALQMLMVIVGLVLLIACANVGNLLLSRAAARKAEISLRLALGASRFRIVRQLLTESLLLAAFGGVVGILLAQWGVKILVALVAKTSPLDVQPDLSILVFTAAVSTFAGLVFGLVPALSASKSDLTTAIKEKSARGGDRRRGRFGLASGLVVAQVGLSMVLLAGAGLFARSLMKLAEADVGFNRDNVLLLSLDPRLGGYKPAQLSALYRQIIDRLRELPGVQSATIASFSPISGQGRNSTVSVRGYTPRPGEDRDVNDILIGPDYCRTLGVPLLLGREIDIRDTPASQKVAVVNQSFAQYFFHGENPIGRRIFFGDEDDPERGEDLEIVGVIGDVRYESAKEQAGRTAYRPILQVQDSDAYNSNIQIRTSGDAASIAPTVRAVLKQIDSNLPVYGINTLRAQLSGALQRETLIAELVSFFGFLALLLACIGLYGVMAHGVVRRTKEIGIRMALGAERRGIVWMVMRETMLLVLVGIVIGVPVALGAARLISSQLFGLSPADPFSLIVSALVLVGVASLAGFLPARKASKVNPLTALRYE
jgi:predicted permease